MKLCTTAITRVGNWSLSSFTY